MPGWPRNVEKLRKYSANPTGSWSQKASSTSATGFAPKTCSRTSASLATTRCDSFSYSASLRMKLIMMGTSLSLAGAIRKLTTMPHSLQSLNVRSNARCQSSQAVPAFQHRKQTAAGMLVGDLAHDARQISEVAVGEQKLSQRIAGSGIEARRDQYEFGFYFFRRGQQLRLERAQNLLASGTRRERAIQRHALALAFAALAARSGSRIPRRLMRAEEKHRSVGIENILRPVAVMDVPIGDEHAPGAMLLLGVACRDRDGVKDTEAHPAHRRGMMSRRPSNADGVRNPLFDDGVHRVQRSARGAQGRVQRFWRNDGVASAQLVKSCEDLAFGQLNVALRVAQREFVVVGEARWNWNEFQIAQRAHRRVESRGLLRMLRPGQMFFANWIRGEPCHYLPNSSKPNVPGWTLRRGRPLASPAAGGSISTSATAR